MSANGSPGIAAAPRAVDMVVADGQLTLGEGFQVDVRTAEGFGAAEEALNSSQMLRLRDLMRASGYVLDGGRFVGTDEFDIRPEGLDRGPQAGDAQMDDLDREIIDRVFTPNNIPSPYNANTTPELYERLNGTEGFHSTTRALTNYLENPTAANQARFLEVWKAASESMEGLNIYEMLFLVMRESIRETNRDKMYFPQKIREFNTIAEALSNYLQELVEDSQNLDKMSQGNSEPDKVTVQVETQSIDLSVVDANGKAYVTPSGSQEWTRQGLDGEIKKVENQQETIRNKRQMASTSFQNFEQKSNQTINLIASLLKTVNEMRQGTTRNML